MAAISTALDTIAGQGPETGINIVELLSYDTKNIETVNYITISYVMFNSWNGFASQCFEVC